MTSSEAYDEYRKVGQALNELHKLKRTLTDEDDIRRVNDEFRKQLVLHKRWHKVWTEMSRLEKTEERRRSSQAFSDGYRWELRDAPRGIDAHVCEFIDPGFGRELWCRHDGCKCSKPKF